MSELALDQGQRDALDGDVSPAASAALTAVAASNSASLRSSA